MQMFRKNKIKSPLFPPRCRRGHEKKKKGTFRAGLGRWHAFIAGLKLSQCTLERESPRLLNAPSSPLLWKLTLRCDFCRVFQLGDPRGLHHHTPSACCQGETVHREHGGAGTGGQRAGQGNTSECNDHTQRFQYSSKKKKKKKSCRSPSCPRIIWDIQPFNNVPLTVSHLQLLHFLTWGAGCKNLIMLSFQCNELEFCWCFWFQWLNNLTFFSYRPADDFNLR